MTTFRKENKLYPEGVELVTPLSDLIYRLEIEAENINAKLDSWRRRLAEGRYHGGPNSEEPGTCSNLLGCIDSIELWTLRLQQNHRWRNELATLQALKGGAS